MSFQSWLQCIRSALTPSRGQRHDGRRFRATLHRPSLEILEDRLTPSFTPVAWTYPVGPNPAYAVGTGDFNNDGHLDLAATNYIDSPLVLLSDGQGGFGSVDDGTFAAPIYSTALTAVADFNGDGRLDVLTVEGGSDFGGVGQVSLGRGDGTFERQNWFEVGLEPRAIATGDFNGDGLPDFAVAGIDYVSGEGAVAVLFNNGDWGPYLYVWGATVTEGNAGTASATFTVTLGAASTVTVTIAYATSNGTATAGSDYQAASGTLTFAPGQTSKTINVLVKGDGLPEPNETFVVDLSSPTYATIADGQAMGTIVDDEPRISISDVVKKEGKKNQTTLFTFTVTLSAAYDQPVTMSYRTADGTATTGDGDYVDKAGTITFAPGETTKTITIEVKGDNKWEAKETFSVDLSGLSSNGLFTKSRGTGTILNDD
jgi:Calx-beta domain/FG-GAP-like repeat